MTSRNAWPARRAGLLAALLLAAGGSALAQTQGGSLPLVIGQGPGGSSYSVPIQTLLFFTALGFIPAVLLLMTAFTRIVIVLSLLRQAIDRLALSARAFHRVRKVARSIADLAGSDGIRSAHVAEAIQYRRLGLE